MNHKVLLADDSLTIQKVIKITLANQPYDITDCGNEDELFHQLSIVQPKLVFLDFNLSEKFTGYELTTKIKSLLPSTKVLLLLGTFDTVDDAAMEKCGASDKIVKPFDSNKFIAICKQLIETFANEDIPYPEAKVETKPVIEESPEDQWTVSHTTEQKLPVEAPNLEATLPDMQNPLAKEMSDWGMSVPNIINDTEAHEKTIDLPPVIGEVKSLDAHREKKAEPVQDYSTKFPQSEDLDYPDMSDFAKPEPVAAPAPEAKPASKLISLETLNSKPFEMELEGSYVPDESDVKSIEAQIRDEVEDNLWQADEFEDLKREVAQKIEEAKNTYQPSRNDFDESLFKPLDEKETIDWVNSNDLFKSESFGTPAAAPQVDMSQMKQEMEELVKKYVKEYVKEYMDEMFKKNTEKVAWEVIPDLAENLIRQELSKISNKIINE